MKKLFISGYRSYELQIFSETDIKLKYLKAYLRKELQRFLEEGWEWFIITGQLGIEQWSAEVILDLKKDYPQAKLAILFPYIEFGHQWNAENQIKIQSLMNQADYVNYTSQQPYFSPRQLQANHTFVLRNTDGLFMIYDDEHPGSPKYLKEMIRQFVSHKKFIFFQTNMSELELFVSDHAHIFEEK